MRFASIALFEQAKVSEKWIAMCLKNLIKFFRPLHFFLFLYVCIKVCFFFNFYSRLAVYIHRWSSLSKERLDKKNCNTPKLSAAGPLHSACLSKRSSELLAQLWSVVSRQQCNLKSVTVDLTWELHRRMYLWLSAGTCGLLTWVIKNHGMRLASGT